MELQILISATHNTARRCKSKKFLEQSSAKDICTILTHLPIFTIKSESKNLEQTPATINKDTLKARPTSKARKFQDQG